MRSRPSGKVARTYRFSTRRNCSTLALTLTWIKSRSDERSIVPFSVIVFIATGSRTGSIRNRACDGEIVHVDEREVCLIQVKGAKRPRASFREPRFGAMYWSPRRSYLEEGER
jgi:hypothetical protein